jgi:small subunit ribosomal protein S20
LHFINVHGKISFVRLEEVKLLANIKSAKKRILVTEKRTALNKSRKSEIKTYIKKFENAVTAGDLTEAKALLNVIDKKLKRAALKNVIHKNAAARKVSRLAKKLNQANKAV